MNDNNRMSDFETFAARCEPLLRRGLVARFGPQLGREMTVHALAVGWERFDQIRTMQNPIGYLYTVGRRSVPAARRETRFEDDMVDPASHEMPEHVDLIRSLSRLSVAERSAVLLLHAYGYTQREAAEVLDVAASTVNDNARRGLERLRLQLDSEGQCDDQRT